MKSKMYRIVFISAFISPHIKPFCDVLYSQYGSDFVYIQMQELTAEREKLGYGYKESEIPYVKNLTGRYAEQKKLVDAAECVIINSGTTSPKIVIDRIKENKLTFFANERLFKRGLLKLLDYRLWLQAWVNIISRGKNVFLLCYGGFVARDFERIGFEKGKSFKFGYFPKIETKEKKNHSKKEIDLELLWVGRMIDWKRPVFALKVLKRLQNDVEGCHLQMIGDGPMLSRARKYALRNKLNVDFLGVQTNEVVREKMAECAVFLFTSNRREGWGAVVNEALSAGTPVVASADIGACKYLIQNGKNGYLFKTYSKKDASQQLIKVLKDEENLLRIGAKKTQSIWNAEVAGRRLIQFIENCLGEQYDELRYESGPMSRA